MASEVRRVAVFMASGCVAAALIGVSVWWILDPSVHHRGAQSDTATAHTVRLSEISAQPRPAASTSSTRPHIRARAQQPAQVRSDDPFLAPRAVVRTQAQGAEPTVVYRPENIAPPRNPVPPVAGPQPADPAPPPAESPAAPPPGTGTEITITMLPEPSNPATTTAPSPTEPAPPTTTDPSSEPSEPPATGSPGSTPANPSGYQTEPSTPHTETEPGTSDMSNEDLGGAASGS